MRAVLLALALSGCLYVETTGERVSGSSEPGMLYHCTDDGEPFELCAQPFTLEATLDEIFAACDFACTLYCEPQYQLCTE